MRRGWLVALVIVVAALPLGAVLIARAAIGLLPERSAWQWHVAPRAMVARTEVAGAALGGDLYVIGGFVSSHRTSAIVERLHGGRWSRVRRLPTALNHAAAVGYRGHVYVVGGYAGATGLTEAVATLYRYDPGPNRWVRLRPMPTARAALALGVASGKLYAAGGSNGRRALRTLEIYDIAGRRWSRGPALSVAREHVAGTVLDGRFYVVGGRSASTGNLALFERYDPARGRWQRLADVPKARGGNGAAAIPKRGAIVAIGGEEAAGTIGEVDLYDVAKRRWQRLPDMPTPRHGLAVLTNPDGDVMAIEGGPQPGFAFSDVVELLTPP